ncbi:DUF1254 domain-containing protein [Aquibium sp. LZ166]|uniref:DUF1254 domain-containing protein n=1 Tax=Aquibium pacificus TaxID=3153579 RepID=A0ABV3SRG1_9HYPH
MLRVLYALLLGLLGAAIVHIVILLLLPFITDKDAWSRLAAEGETFEMVSLSSKAAPAPVVTMTDPFIRASACRFDLTQGIARITAQSDVPFWSVSIYDRRGHNVYSFNDRTATAKALDLAIVSPTQMLELRKSLPDEFAKSLFVEFAQPAGIVVIRAFVPDETFEPAVEGFFTSASCRAS